MTLTVKASPIIESLISYMDDIQTRYEKIPRGVFIDNNSEWRRIYDEAHQAERNFVLASDLLSISTAALYGAVLAARRWYYRTDWQKCLPEEVAQRLLACMIEQNRPQKEYERSGGNDYLLFMNKVISDWAKKSMEKKAAS